MMERLVTSHLFFLIFFLGLTPVQSMAAGELDDLLEGFGGTEAEEVPVEEESQMFPEWFELTGVLRLQSTLSFSHDAPGPDEPDYRGLSMLRTGVELLGDWSRWGWKGRLGVKGFYDAAYEVNGEKSHYSNDFLDEYESELELSEVYIQGSLSRSLDLKVGRQLVVWGKSDNIRITDILNPLDVRQPGLVDIRDLRLPVTMTRLDYYFGDWNLSTILVHEPRFDKPPVYNGDFYPGERPPPEEQKPVVSLDNQQVGLALNGIFSGWDLSLYAASVFDARSHIEMVTPMRPIRKHERVFMTGLAANMALGNWLLKTEVAYWDGLRFSTVTSGEKNRLDLLAAFEYQGFTDTTISFEVANRHLFDFDAGLESLPDAQQEDLFQYAIRFVQNYRNDTLHFTLLHTSYGIFEEDGGFTRCQLEYDIDDSFSITGGVVFYSSGDFLPFQNIGDNDRLLLEVEYRF